MSNNHSSGNTFSENKDSKTLNMKIVKYST